MNNQELTAAAKVASMQDAAQSMTKTNYDTIKGWLSKGSIFDQFMTVCGEDYGRRFMQSILAIMKNPQYAMLNRCEPATVVQSAMVAACTGLSLDPNLSQSALIPYGDRCTFQIMKRGLQQLAMRSGMVKTFNVAKVFEGDFAECNPITGEYRYNQEPHARDIAIGYISYIRQISGFEKYEYWTIEQCRAHGARYSKTFNYKGALWQTNFDMMAEKTVMKKNLRESAIIDPSMTACRALELALKFDEGTPKTLNLDAVEYPDSQTYEEYIETKIEPKNEE